MPKDNGNAFGKLKVEAKPVTGTDDGDILETDESGVSSRINGGDGNDSILGSDQADRVNAGDGDDTVIGGAGDDILFGNDGSDTAVFSGSILDYAWEWGRGNTLHVAGQDGNDQLRHFEFLQFDDYTYSIYGNNPPLVIMDVQSAPENGLTTLTFSVYDFDGDTLSVDSVAMSDSDGQPGTGSLGLLLPAVNIVSSAGWNGTQYTVEFDPGTAFDYLSVNQTVTETITVTVSDGNGGTSVITRELNITGLNDGVVITSGPQADTITEIADGTVGENSDVHSVNGSVTFEDVDLLDSHTVTVTPLATGYLGTLAHVVTDSTGTGAGQVDWTFDVSDADLDWMAQDDVLVQTYTVTIADGNGSVQSQDITITLRGTNDAPVAVDDVATTDENVAVTIDVLANDTDVDHTDTLTLDSVSVTSGGGVATLVAGQVQWTPGTDYDYLAVDETATVLLSYDMSDNHGAVSTGTVTITVRGTNDAPVAFADTGTTDENTAVLIDVLANDTDLDLSDTHTVDSVSVTSGGGTASLVGDQVQWDPGTDYDYLSVGESAVVELSYQMSDNHGASDTSTVTLTVTGVNDGIEITSTAQSRQLVELANTTGATNTSLASSGNLFFEDVDLNDAHFLSVTPGGSGYLGQFENGLNDSTGTGTGSVWWNFQVVDADLDFLAEGEQRIQTYTITLDDSNGSVVSQDVTITLTGSNDAPIAVYDVAQAVEGNTILVSGNVGDNDSDPDNGAVLSYGLDAPVAGLTMASDGSWTFDPTNSAYDYLNEGQIEDIVASYTVTDDKGATDTATLTITMTGTNDIPVIAGIANGVVAEDGAFALPVKLIAPDGVAGDQFSYNATSVSADGSTIVVGANFDDGVGPDSGSAYVFDAQGNLVSKLTAPDAAAGDRFGVWSVVSADGQKILVGSMWDDDNGTNSGSAYLFNRDGSLIAKLTAPDGTSGDNFGVGCSISLDGNTIVVGAYQDGSGSAYVFDGSGTFLTKITPPDGAFGDQFGISTSISGNGDRIVIGSMWDDDNGFDSGSAYVFDRSGTLLQKLTPPDGNSGDRFGIRTAISDDGNTMVIAAEFDDDNGPNSGSVYFYNGSGSLVTKVVAPDGGPYDEFGRNVSISGDGQTILVGARSADGATGNSGAAYVFDNTGNLIAKLSAPDGAPGDQFGWGASISNDGDTIVIPAFGDDDNGTSSGSAYVFSRNANGDFVDYQGNIYGPSGIIGTQPANEPDLTTSGALTIDDPDDGQSSFQAIAAGTAGDNGHGSFEMDADGRWVYTLDNASPTVQALALGESLTDTITALSLDGTASALISVTINGTNDGPVATDDANTSDPVIEAGYAVVGDPTASGNVLTNDTDIDTTDVLAVSHVMHSSHIAPEVLPNSGTLQVTGTYGTLTMNDDGSWSYLLDDSDPDTEALATGEQVQEVFTYTVDDGNGGFDTATLTIEISGSDDNVPPVAVDDTFTAFEDVASLLNLVTNDTDANGDVINITHIDGTAVSLGDTVTLASGAAVTLIDGQNVLFDPFTNWSGSESFSYQTSDGLEASNVALVEVTVTPVADSPVVALPPAGSPATQGNEDQSLPIGLSAYLIDTDGSETMDLRLSGFPTGATFNLGTADGSDWIIGAADMPGIGSLAMTPPPNWNGNFTLTVVGTATETANNATASNSATQHYVLTAVNDDPTAQNDAVDTDEDTVLSGNVLTDNGSGADSDLDGDAVFVASVAGSSANVGTQILLSSGALLELNADGSFDYDPNGAFDHLTDVDSATDSFDYEISDGMGGSGTATVTVTIRGLNDAPTLDADTMAADEDGAIVTLDLGTIGADEDSDDSGASLTYTVSGQPTDGSASVSGTTLSFDPGAGFQELAQDQTTQVTIQVTAEDGHGLTATNDVTVTVTGVNDAPEISNFTLTTNEDAGQGILGGSDILDYADLQTLGGWMGQSGLSLEKVFTKELGDTAHNWHTAVDNVGPTITVMELDNGNIIGGYNPYSWVSAYNYTYAYNTDAFLFNLSTDTLYEHSRYNTVVYNGPNYGPTFGGGHDLYVNGNLTTGYANIGYTYGDTSRYGQSSYRNEFTGSYNGWNIVALETFTLGAGSGGGNGGELPTLDLSTIADDIDSDNDGINLTYTITGSPTDGTASISGHTLTFDPGDAFQYLRDGESATVQIEVTATDIHGVNDVATVTVVVEGKDEVVNLRVGASDGTTNSTAPGGISGATGTGGSFGSYDGGNGTDGTNGSDGQDASAIHSGDSHLGENSDDRLTLYAEAYGQNGGTGGYGGTGGGSYYNSVHLYGSTSSSSSPGNFRYDYGQAGDGGNGGHGGAGGDAFAALDTNILDGEGGSDRLIFEVDAIAGRGGTSGIGGVGGHGGHTGSYKYSYTSDNGWWGSSTYYYQIHLNGGFHGDSGDSGQGGAGGLATAYARQNTGLGEDGDDIVTVDVSATGGNGGTGISGRGGRGNSPGRTDPLPGEAGDGGNGGDALAEASDNILSGGDGQDTLTVSVNTQAGHGSSGGGTSIASVYHYWGTQNGSSSGFPDTSYTDRTYYYGNAADGGDGGDGGDAMSSAIDNDLLGGAGNDNLELDLSATAGNGGSGGIPYAGNSSGTYNGTYYDYNRVAGTTGANGQVGQQGDAALVVTGNTLSGGAGDDVLSVSLSVSGRNTSLVFDGNTFDGGSGYDTLDLRGITASIGSFGSQTAVGAQIDLGAGTLVIGSIGSNTITEIEHVIGTNAADQITGSEDADRVNSGGGSDTITLGLGADIFEFSDGQNTITDFDIAEDRIALNGSVTFASLDRDFNGVIDAADGVTALPGSYNFSDDGFGNLVITDSGNSSRQVTLDGVSQLLVDDFVF